MAYHKTLFTLAFRECWVMVSLHLMYLFILDPNGLKPLRFIWFVFTQPHAKEFGKRIETNVGNAYIFKTIATILVNAGTNLIASKRYGGWKSSNVAEECTEKSIV